MCTLSVIPLGHAALPHLAGEAGFRVVVNRDEQRDRPAALQPRWRAAGEGDGRAIWPIDPRGGGTWVAASERGLVLALLNVNLEPAPTLPRGMHSRGEIIPRLIDSEGAAEAVSRLSGFDLDRFAPFRVVAVGPDRAGRDWNGGMVVQEARWDRARLVTRALPAGAACFVSSGLGDSRVTPRLELFRELVAAAPVAARQDAFHDHAWAGRESTSVMMSREDARTVSVTAVEIRPRTGASRVQVRMTYRPVYDAQVALAAAPRM